MQYKYVSAETLKYIDQLLLELAGVTVEGELSGKHKSKLIGKSLEFVQYREYSPGDDIKFIDWKVYARRDRFFVKQFQQETNLTGYIFLDCSMSMYYPVTGMTKYEYGSYLVSYLSYILLNQGDSVGVVKFDSRIREVLPASCKENYYYEILRFLEKELRGEHTKFDELFKSIVTIAKKKNVVVIISDLICSDENFLIKILREISSFGIYLIILHIVDRKEELLEIEYDSCTLVDIEQCFSPVKTKLEEIRDYYHIEFNKLIDFYRQNLNDKNIKYFLVRTELPIITNLKFILEQQ